MLQAQLLNAIRRIMKIQGVSQSDLASILECSQASISQLLKGATKLTVEDLEKISVALQTHPTTLMEDASNKVASSVNLEERVQDLVCDTADAFHLFNILKQPSSVVEIESRFPEESLIAVRAKLDELKKLNIVTTDLDGRLKLNLPEAGSIHFEIDESYNKRIIEVFARTRSQAENASGLDPIDLSNWKKMNCDALYLNYFSDEQAEEQVRLMRHLMGYVRHQLRANRLAALTADTSQGLKRGKLRVVYLTNMEYPTGL
ncbi:MAG: helix-turn-helix domain-containing protein [Bdellovibrionales bacterium]|nr:helix-turn-helix domain-containing protein [Bdellovibrionales bacterium]